MTTLEEKLANALDDALDLLADYLREDHPEMKRLGDVLGEAEAYFAREYFQEIGLTHILEGTKQ